MGQRTMLLSMDCRLTCAGSTLASRVWIRFTQASTSGRLPSAAGLAIAPAATRQLFPGRGATAAATGLDAVFGLISAVSMGWAKGNGHVAVIARALVLVANQHGDGGPEGCAAIQQPLSISTLSASFRGVVMGLARSAAIKLLNGLQIKLQARGTALHNHTNTTTMGFAECADPEEVAEAAAHG